MSCGIVGAHLRPQEIATMTILHRPVLLAGAGLRDAWLLFRDGQMVDVWMRLV